MPFEKKRWIEYNKRYRASQTATAAQLLFDYLTYYYLVSFDDTFKR